MTLYWRPMKALQTIALCAAILTVSGFSIDVWASPSAATTPAATQQMAISSHGSTLLGVFYLAAGEGPHPTAILFHGFPGYEQNLDIAQFLRAHGWNVLAMHYRGSWGVKGNFSFTHAAEDADTEVQFLIDPANQQKYRIDAHRISVIGHSMGGYMAASAIAHNPQVAAAVVISAWNIGRGFDKRHQSNSKPSTAADEAKELAKDNNLTPLAGTSGLALAREIRAGHQSLNLLNLASQIAPRPVFVITASDGLAPSDHAMAEALTKAGDTHVTERHWDTDHSYSGQRAELSSAIYQWLSNLPH